MKEGEGTGEVPILARSIDHSSHDMHEEEKEGAEWRHDPITLIPNTTHIDTSGIEYFREVDVWATGCLYSEMRTGDPLFPGESDIDQLFLITQCLGA